MKYSIRKCKRKVRAYYSEIINYPTAVDCGHGMLKILRPDLYSKLNTWWDRLAEVDSDCPNKPKWLQEEAS
jgi:hypothetical protein